MAYKETFSCDSCGIVKKETNNWFIISDRGISGYQTINFDYKVALSSKMNKTVFHACGIECAAKLEARLKAKMQSGDKVEKPVENDVALAQENDAKIYS